MAERCPSGKVSYDSRAEASQRAARARRRVGKVLRAYLCPLCVRFHLTSQVQR